MIIYNMCGYTGDKKQEEKLMREWFQLLNEKNNIIRRQVELNLRYTNHASTYY